MSDLEQAAVVGVAIAVPAALAIGLAALAAQRGQEYVLVVTVSGPGTVDITEGTHSYPGPTQVNVNATPNMGYQANWNVNGVDVEKGVNSYSVYVNGVVTLGVYFTPVGPPHGTIAGIRSVGTVGTLQNFRFSEPQATGGIQLDECDENWNLGQTAAQLMQFKVYDQGYVGIPDVPVNVYPDINPDATVFKGLALLQPIGLIGPFPIYDPSNPLVLVTDSQGLVSFSIRTVYTADNPILDGGGKVLSQQTNLYADKFCALAGNVRVSPIYNKLAAGVGCFWTGGGGGGTVTYNRNIRADIINSAYYTLQPYSVGFASKFV